MRVQKKSLWAAFLLVICLVIKWFSLDAERVELWYSSSFFYAVANILRTGLGKFSISIGDILYGIAVAWLIFRISRGLFFIFKNKKKDQFALKLKQTGYRFFITAAVVYILFNVLWGINYNRKGIAWQLGLSEIKYTTQELKEINWLLISKINAAKQNLVNKQQAYPANNALFKKVDTAYSHLQKQYTFLRYFPSSLKSSLWGWFGNYASFTGYYNPFTGEAHLNTSIPKFLQPFTACHEVAHQLGYAKENEANFVGYLAAVASSDTLFHYSAYLDLFMYANRNLYTVDSVSARIYTKELIEPVKNDLKEWRLFNEKHRGLLEPLVRWGYGKFLQTNEQPQGLLSYDEVTGFLIAYYKKYGKL